MSLLRSIARHPIIPVIIVEQIEDAVPLGQALVDGGLPVLEVTLRTPVALEAIKRMAAEIDGAIVGAGTLRHSDDIQAAKAAGATFGVSPGSPATLLQAAQDAGLPLLPGVASATEAMNANNLGYQFLKFFPAEASGGAKAIAALASPLAGLVFCPTGGVGLGNLSDYLSCPNVVCAGGSWMLPKDLIAAKNWTKIRDLAADAKAAALAAGWQDKSALIEA
jgi:2-dehydro-3-deoxyphosphogluconate aldolase/(4S)-4-hydroxy-2-oxoglutarate aldolase